ncbi:6-carboxytetrahydropterin synthase QueD [candidate division WOR-1 bacterium RIFOXYA12_FULL_43_27]|uniref:6-carboxy-5,6,7,8-tetrahydropterin synthase n=1 Tax=candidate division WOR-1 bacterium RIFOXYC2_FULL_46_14 TaxID=1802587 RepID=A0A1F4U699_UNCSA|nr:MAG: 6-carboxytetrahydropterin synthase QueD [candidate division WOR-1 bacterium RIFOXYA12_FULL_43_27]OGC20939.1 MAG: 6-carboxytetrahydropterin synthase QueD [candidate division WOR-1 bacterium RIFOXYB2_FULL_46_45]OGC32300.1 MAG: 6-carboxytetrahydropterin synthase QueD [candidate division WOR-1 bacterium RIFOXYA2_FULL_46_56]OGC40495.1 MAG: 6-carboxytetrahydropterin synthase QueD [candidate division WOR-1 bacterium RIFOXYC2_FULL_46_14]
MVEDTFSAAHQLRGYKGKCENLHGHTFKVQVFISGTKLDQTGMLKDFTEIKAELKKVLEEFDHHNLNELPLFAKQNPTAENLAREIYNRIKASKVIVWESDKACASYS